MDINSKILKIIMIKLPNFFDFKHYLDKFKYINQEQIYSYHQYSDQLINFTSQMLQKYYLAYGINTSPKHLYIDYTEYHKPFLVNQRITYNIAHSGKYVVLAIYNNTDYQIGVDIEKVDYSFETIEMAKIVFSPIEQQLIQFSKDYFFKLWTKKEALIKAQGVGFATDFYQGTKLNLEDYEINDQFIIATTQLEEYFLSICLYKTEGGSKNLPLFP